MKKYMLFTKNNFDEEYHTFQGDFDNLSEALRKTWCAAHNRGDLLVYKIVSYIRETIPRTIAEGFINPEEVTPER